MPWVKVSDDFPFHPAIADVGVAGAGYFILMLCYSNHMLTEGFVPEAIALRLATVKEQPHKLITALLKVELLTEAVKQGVKGYQLAASFVADQPTREAVEKKRAETKARQQRWRDNERQQREADKNITEGETRYETRYDSVDETRDGRARDAPPYPCPCPCPSPSPGVEIAPAHGNGNGTVREREKKARLQRERRRRAYGPPLPN